MKLTFKKFQLRKVLVGLLAVAIIFGLTASSALAVEVSDECQAYKQKQAEKQLPPHKRPAPAEPGASEGKGNQHANLAAAATNPLSNLIQFQMQDQYNSDVDNAKGYNNAFLIQPVIPVKLPWKKVPMGILRLTLPYVSSNKYPVVGREHGFGDFTALAIANVPLAKGQTMGIGASLVFPTAGDNLFTGSGKYQGGPAWAYVNTMIKGWQLGAFGWQHWDYANGPSGKDRAYVNEHSVQPLIVKHFSEGWYVRAQDIPWKYDFRLDNWSMPMGPVVGKVAKIGKLPINMFAGVYYDPMTHNDATSNTWSFKLNMTFLFPE
jgi:hypothetical protein